jgi:uncharacterized RDD family membrane protein YckC
MRASGLRPRKGSEVATSFCSQCGAQLRSDARFCATCGAAVEALAGAGAPGAGGFGAPAVAGMAEPGFAATAPQYAGFWIRFVAIVIDIIILAIVNSFIGIIFGQGASGTSGLPALLSLAVGAAYYIVAYSRYGQSVGKLAMGIKVVDVNGGLLSPGGAGVRYIGYWVSSIILLIGYLMVIWDPRKQGLHDKMAGSFVIHVRR